MEKSRIATQPSQAAGVENNTPPPSSNSAPPRGKKRFTPEERKVALAFISAAFQEYKVYRDMTVEEVEDEYRRAGKLDKLDFETEMLKRCARVTKKYPPPDGFYPELKEYLKLIEDED
ncbi:unnamed protein product [Urochloa decumbens]|uniref:Uncharacterized protein n=1 Tax=Urochloa decumbens TaxID=240449 RepID=A0ABC8Z057_9POAL